MCVQAVKPAELVAPVLGLSQCDCPTSFSGGKLTATEVDINFMRHELREAELMKQGMEYSEAHEAVLKEQGMFGKKYHELLYTKEAIEAGDAAEAAKYGIKR